MRKLFNCILLLISLACTHFSEGELNITLAEINAEHINMDVLQHNIPQDTTFIITNTGACSEGYYVTHYNCDGTGGASGNLNTIDCGDIEWV